MKKYLMMAVAGLALASCNKMDDYTMSQSEITKAKYDQAFVNYIGGAVAQNRDWGFSSDAYTRAAFTRSQAAPAVLSATKPYDEAWVADYLTTAKEPDATNSTDNYDNTSYAYNYSVVNNLVWENGGSDYYWLVNNSGKSWEEQKAWCLENHPEWLTFNQDEAYVTNFKITGTQNGSIAVVATEDADGDPRTVVVTGTWNLTAEQRVGGGGKIIVANGGKINLASGANLNSVNEAQIVVLPGGEISGDGQIAFCNGTNNDLLSGNWGTINVGTFNNNGGNFYNYGTLKANKMDGGAGNSRYYNHSVISINETGSSANIRIYNGCQFYVKNNARIRNYEGINGSALVVDGELMFSSSADGTNDPTYVSLAGGALVKCATLYNQGTSWSGPTGTEYAALEITDKIVYLNWEQDHPENGGYFENNIYVKAGTWSNVPTGNGWQSGETSTADYKFFQIVANCRGNNGVKKVTEGTTEFIPKSDDFVKGESGCTPGFTADVPPIIPDTEYDIRIIAEDLSAQGASDFDFNDVVLDVKFGSKAQILLTHAGGTLPLCIGVKDLAHEVHNLFGVWKGEFPTQDNATVERQEMVNTGAGPSKAAVDITDVMNVAIADAAAANTQLRLYVYKDGTWQEMQAPKGEPACKLAVDENFVVLPERRSIKGTYPLFVTWATTEGFSSKWW